ncbi:SusD/RagB family nutrient-binding outer membrane lipoprotein [Paraflavitalea pollutisoli]|uniref:SusD/RagB family nutrient-binding outer membrane lipoprotein n=1 Tax=Paraflavitalea pollutisoli TaxID=3034143 RepID=UPI0023ED4DF1|nr:SusD/RagB family nutrient-binding outer membrane lipoprotein [Paraflavitalea sp. H1-2-19X]
MKKHSLLYIAITLLAVAGCRKYLDVNEDPRTPQQTTAETLLPHMQSYMGYALGLDGRYTGKYVQYWVSNAANDGVEGHGSATGTEMWTMHYTKLGLAIDQMLNDAVLNEKWYYAGIAKALRAWSWQLSTDHFGPMILKQAWETDRYIFDYDSQEEIYKEVEKLCNESLEYFNRESAKTILGSSDYIFKGNKDRWVKFVYGVLAINANHLSNKATYNPAKVIEYADKSMADNVDNARIQYNGTTGGSATTSDAFVLGPKRANITSLSYVQSSVIVNMLKGYHRGVSVEDPRIINMIQLSADSTYNGAVPTSGDPNSAATNKKRIPAIIGGFAAPWPGRYLFRDTVNFPIMTYSQIQFIKAEAAFKSGQLGIAYTAYKNGIDKSIDLVSSLGPNTITAAKKNTFLASAAVAQTDADLTIKDIMCQKYIALWGWGFEETWADLRRYNYDTTVFKGYVIPELSKISSSNDGKLVQRYRPQNTEYLYNVDALNKIGATRDNYHTDTMWFAKP